MLTRAVLDAITLGKTTFEKEVVAGNIKIQGNGKKLGELMSLLDDFKGGFNVVTP
jgi:alkyl sulfatase BDS1-like metallo-beta-lactamase superfamily hydrolase